MHRAAAMVAVSVIGTLALIVAACSATPTVTMADRSGQAPRASSQEQTAADAPDPGEAGERGEASDTEVAAGSSDDWTWADLVNAVETAEELDPIQFNSIVTFVHADVQTASVFRHGDYRVSAQTGVAFEARGLFTVARDQLATFTLDKAELFEQRVSGRDLSVVEIRLIGDDLWGRDDLGWFVLSATDAAGRASVGPEFNFNGRRWIELVMRTGLLESEVTGQRIASGGARFDLNFDAGTLAPVTDVLGIYQQLQDNGDGAADDEMVVPGFAELRADGSLAYIEVDMSAWWTDPVRRDGISTPAELDDAQITLRLAFGPGDASLIVEPGCASPQPAPDGFEARAVCPCPLNYTPDLDAAQGESPRPVLVVTAPIPAGTSVRELLDFPTSYLAAQVVPAEPRCPSWIGNIARLQDVQGFTVVDEVPVGVILDTRHLAS